MGTKVNAVGASLGLGAQLRGTAKAPLYLMRSDLQERLQARGVKLNWAALVEETHETFDDRLAHWPQVRSFVNSLASTVEQTAQAEGELLVIGGDHAGAMGTWPGVVAHLNCPENFGLIWIDAHMDAHTAETSPSGAMHGMPLAALLGEGKTAWKSTVPYLKPEHVVLIGIRSFEEGEAALLAEQGVKIYTIDEVQKRGFDAVFKASITMLNKQVKQFGVTLDLDGFDPRFAPGVGSPEANGLVPHEVLPSLAHLKNMAGFSAFELVEFNPELDEDGKTEKLIEDIIVAIYAKE